MGFLLLGLGAVAIATFRRLTGLADTGNRGARLLALLESFGLLIPAGSWLLGALISLALRCDEGCDESGAMGGPW
jgi:hypothetical protein